MYCEMCGGAYHTDGAHDQCGEEWARRNAAKLCLACGDTPMIGYEPYCEQCDMSTPTKGYPGA